MIEIKRTWLFNRWICRAVLLLSVIIVGNIVYTRRDGAVKLNYHYILSVYENITDDFFFFSKKI